MTQQSLFEQSLQQLHPHPTPAGELGMARVAEKADRVTVGWTETAFRGLSKWVNSSIFPFTIEQARREVTGWLVPEPHDGRAWGAVTVRAVREGVIVATGCYASANSSHGSPKMLYVKGAQDVR